MVGQFLRDDLFEEVTAVQYLGLGLPPGLARSLQERVEPGQLRPVGLLLAPVQTVRRLTASQVSQIFLFELNIVELNQPTQKLVLQ